MVVSDLNLFNVVIHWNMHVVYWFKLTCACLHWRRQEIVISGQFMKAVHQYNTITNPVTHIVLYCIVFLTHTCMRAYTCMIGGEKWRWILLNPGVIKGLMFYLKTPSFVFVVLITKQCGRSTTITIF